MSIARIAIFDAGITPTRSDTVELPEVELVRSSHIVDVYRSGQIGWSEFRNSDNPYNQIDTHINALIAIRDRMRDDAADKARAEEEARREDEKVRNARVVDILIEAGCSITYVSDTARRLAEKVFELEQEAKKK